MNNLLCFDLMEKIGQEVKIIRQTETNKQNYNNIINDINTLRPLMVEFTNEHYYWEGDHTNPYLENEEFIFCLVFSSQLDDDDICSVKLPFIRSFNSIEFVDYE